MNNAPYGIEVKVNGKKVTKYYKDGKCFIWARPGTEFVICAWNHTSQRVEVVITVDGLNICTGDTGNFVTQRGYIITPGSSIEIPGFSLNSKEVAKFTFGAPEKSYAALMSKPDNIGVIGAAFFPEKEVVYKPCGTADWPAINKGSGLEKFSLPKESGASVGTAFGKAARFSTKREDFYRGDHYNPTSVLTIFYHTKERLKKMGIDLYRKNRAKTIAYNPNPFPRNETGCKPPKHWNRG